MGALGDLPRDNFLLVRVDRQSVSIERHLVWEFRRRLPLPFQDARLVGRNCFRAELLLNGLVYVRWIILFELVVKPRSRSGTLDSMNESNSDNAQPFCAHSRWCRVCQRADARGSGAEPGPALPASPASVADLMKPLVSTQRS